MSFDFPASPTENQTFDAPGGPKYIYKSPVWKIAQNANVGTAFIHCADTPPASPSHGQQWFETDSGNTFVWMDDGTSQQWVQMNGTGLPDAPVDAKQYVRSNALWVENAAGMFKISEAGPLASVATIEIALPTGWKGYELYLNDISPAVNATTLLGRFSFDGGSTYVATATYADAFDQIQAHATTVSSASSVAQTYITLSFSTNNTSSTLGFSKLIIPKPAAGNGQAVIHDGHFIATSPQAAYLRIRGFGRQISTLGPATNIRIIPVTGNIQAGASWQLNGWR